MEWLSDGMGTGSYRQLNDAINRVGMAGEKRFTVLRELSDCSILDFLESGQWKVQPTRLTPIRQEASGVRAIVCGARDSRVTYALSSLSSDVRQNHFGAFGLQLEGPWSVLEAWAKDHGITIEPHWIALQIFAAMEQLGFANVRRAATPSEQLPEPVLDQGTIEVRRLSRNFKRETVSTLPRAESGMVVEVQEPYTLRRLRFVGTAHGWLRTDYLWAPWVCAAGCNQRLATIGANSALSIPLWARLPDGLSRAVTLASGTPWQEVNGRFVSGSVPPTLLYNLKRILNLN